MLVGGGGNRLEEPALVLEVVAELRMIGVVRVVMRGALMEGELCRSVLDEEEIVRSDGRGTRCSDR